MKYFRIIAAAALFSAVGSVAKADIVTMLTAPPTAVSGGYLYTYSATLAGGQLDATDGSAPVQFGTLYDFGDATFVGATGLLATDFTFSFDDISSPAAYLTQPADNANLANVRYTYVGQDNIVVNGQMTTKAKYLPLSSDAGNLGTFSLISPFGTTTVVNYDGQSYKGSNDLVQGNVGQATAPSAVTPEPSSLILLGTGLLGAATGIRRRIAAAL